MTGCHKQDHKRVNKQNRRKIERYIYKRFDVKSRATTREYRGETIQGSALGKISIIDIWDVENEVQNFFNLTDSASQKIVGQIIRASATRDKEGN